MNEAGELGRGGAVVVEEFDEASVRFDAGDDSSRDGVWFGRLESWTFLLLILLLVAHDNYVVVVIMRCW